MTNFSSLKALLAHFQDDLGEYRHTGEFSSAFYEALYEFYLSAGVMPYGIARARTGDPTVWVSRRLRQDLGL